VLCFAVLAAQPACMLAGASAVECSRWLSFYGLQNAFCCYSGTWFLLREIK
jgi:hypothetical protein